MEEELSAAPARYRGVRGPSRAWCRAPAGQRRDRRDDRPGATAGSGATRAREAVSPSWREGTWTRAEEIESLCTWIRQRTAQEDAVVVFAAIGIQLRAAEEAALSPPRRRLRDRSLLERAMSRLVDQQAHTVLDRVRSGGPGDPSTPRGEAGPSSPR